MLISLTDLEQMGQSALAEFEDEVLQLDPLKREEFVRQVERLEAKLGQLYAVAATVAQRPDKLEEVAAIWSQMVSLCDRSAQTVSQLRQTYRVADSAGYDRILDIRNECEENRALHA